MIQQSPEKTKRFLKAINNAAMQKCTDIANQIDETTKLEMERAEVEASKNGHEKIRAAEEKIKSNSRSEIANYNLLKRKEIYEKRNKYQKQVFEEASIKISEFVKTDDYVTFIEKSLKGLSDKVGNNATVYISPNDKKYCDLIKEVFSEANVEIDNEIKLGGIKILDNDKGLLFDDTLDSRLLQQKDWFLINAKMQIDVQ